MLSKIKKSLTTNKKNIAKISSGTLLGQVISIILLPILTRIYGPTVIGFWTLLIAISTIIRSFSDIGLTKSIMIEEDENIERTYKVITTTVLFISILSSMLITMYFSIVPTNISISLTFLFAFSMVLFFTTQQIQVCYTWLNRKGEYNVLMKNPLINNLVYGSVAVSLGLLGMDLYGYFIGHIVGQVVTLIHMKRHLPNKFFTFKFEDYKLCISNNKRFVKYQMPTGVLTNFKNQLPILLIEGLWGTKLLGYYSITVRLLGIPITILASAIGRVFFQTISNKQKKGNDIGYFVFRNMTNGMKVAIIPIALLMAFGDIITIIFLGSDWKIAGDFVRILAIQYFFMFLMNTVQGLEVTINKQKYAMISCIVQIFFSILGALIGKFVFDDIYFGLFLMTIFFIIINITYFSILFKVMNISSKKYIKNAILCVLLILLLSAVFRSVFNFFGIIDIMYRF